jgi:hypothetical protein
MGGAIHAGDADVKFYTGTSERTICTSDGTRVQLHVLLSRIVHYNRTAGLNRRHRPDERGGAADCRAADVRDLIAVSKPSW